MAMQTDGKHPLAQGSCRGHYVSPSVPQPTSPRAVPHPSPWQRIFHIPQYLLPLWSVMLAAPGTLQAGSGWMSVTHPSTPERGGESRDRSRCSPECPQVTLNLFLVAAGAQNGFCGSTTSI